MIEKTSPHSVADTMDRLEAAVKKKGINVIARVNHTAAAQKSGMELRPTETLIFGNPVLGTPLMQSAQSISVDLPLRIAVWKNESGDTIIGYRDPGILAASHGIIDKNAIIAKMAAALDGLTNSAST